MKERVFGYWTLAWVGLVGNIIALPIIALIISYGPPLKVANITLAISIWWPSAIVGIVSSSALLAEKKWGVILTLVSLSMIISDSSILYCSINQSERFFGCGLTLSLLYFPSWLPIYWSIQNVKKP